jgi:hypothetical protein
MNIHIRQRLEGIVMHLRAVHAAGVQMSSSSKGREREAFINDFLKAVFPPIYRFGSGDITDLEQRTSGQVDIVIEYPFGPTIPEIGQNPVRLYLAETVACLVEVKSDLQKQWDEAQTKATSVAALSRVYGGMISFNRPGAHMTIGGDSSRIPYIAVGYRGWQTYEGIRSAFDKSNGVSAVLTIDPLCFISSDSYYFGGPNALWLMICHMQHEIQRIAQASMNPELYGVSPEQIKSVLGR